MEEMKMRTITDLFKDSWQVFARIWKKYLALYLITILVVFGTLGAVAVYFGSAVGKILKSNPDLQGIVEQMFTRNWPLFVLLAIVLIVFATILSLSINKIIYDAAEGEETTIKEGLSYGASNFIRYFWVSLVVGLVIVLGFLFLIIPGLYAMTVFSLVPAVFVREEIHSLGVLKRSRELVHGNFWRVFGRLLLLFALILSISELTQDKPLISLVLNFIFTPISVAYIYLIYKDLAATK